MKTSAVLSCTLIAWLQAGPAVGARGGAHLPPLRLGNGQPAIPPLRLAAGRPVSLYGNGLRTGAEPAAEVQSAPPERPPSPKPAAAAGPAPDRATDLNFDLFPAAPQQSLALSAAQVRKNREIDQKVKLRRQMLVAHQTFGFVALGTLAATLVIGQLNYQDKYVSGDFTGRYVGPHLGLSAASTTLFATTGALALFAPNPYPKPIRMDSALVHKLSMALATAGMAAQIVLGPLTVSRVGKLDQPSYALAHLVTGYATWAFMATGVIAYVF